MIRNDLRSAVVAAMNALGVSDVPQGVVVERPGNPDHGDWSTNAALVCSKILDANPRGIGQRLADHLNDDLPPHVDSIEVAGPGFVNFRLANSWLHEVLAEVVAQGEANYGRLTVGNGTKVNVEFVSANPTGPLHAGHGRWAAYGDSLSRMLERAGYVPLKEFYINDRGVQIDVFAESLLARKAGEEPNENGYQGQYVIDYAEQMPVGLSKDEAKEWGLAYAHREQERALAGLHVHFDVWSSERALVANGAMDAVLQELRGSGHVFEEDGAVWLRTTDFGDDKDRVIVRSDGEPTYMLPDIAYHHDKYNRGDHLIDILGADHHGYVPRMKAALQALGHPAESYEAIIGQNVKLVREGQEVKLSKRTGTMIELADLVDEVGPDVARFAYLLQSIDTTQTLDIDVLKAQAAENPVYYVQYAHARIHAISAQAAEREIKRLPIDDVELALLVEPRELELMRSLSALPEVLEVAVNDRAPHRIATWVRELAGAFHGFYRDCPVLRSDVDPDLTQARLWLVEATRIGLAIGLDLLGADAPERM